MKITTDSDVVVINCQNCNDLNVFAQNANNFTMQYNMSNYGQLYLDNVTNIFIELNGVRNTLFFAPYAENIRVLMLDTKRNTDSGNSDNIFRFDYAKKIDFYSNYATEITIIASHAEYFNFNNSYSYLPGTSIYCPYQVNSICNINLPQSARYYSSRPLNIYFAELLSDLSPLNIDFGSHKQINLLYNRSLDLMDYRIENIILWCNQNEQGIYESFTEIYYSFITKQIECRNISSECCYINNNSPLTDIVCSGNEESCIVDCTLTDCIHRNIHTSELTNYLSVLCGKYDCFNTMIYCPTTFNSSCMVSCDSNNASCYYTTIKYNTNNRNIDINCIHSNSCQGMQVFVDEIKPHANVLNNINILCRYCADSAVIINTKIKQLNIDCTHSKLSDSCRSMLIHAVMTEKIVINAQKRDDYGKCLWYNHDHMVVYGKSIHLNCEFNTSCTCIKIHSVNPNELDYITTNIVNVQNEEKEQCPIGLVTQCSDTQEISRVNRYCECSSVFSGFDISCCPLSTNYNLIYHCDDGTDCKFHLNDTYAPTIIYANNARKLSLSLQDTSNVNIFASNAFTVDIKCIGKCNDIRLNGKNIKSFYLKCVAYTTKWSWCQDLIIDVSNAEDVNIEADIMHNVHIYALNALKFSFACTESCHTLDLFIPSSSEFYLHANSIMFDDYDYERGSIYSQQYYSWRTYSQNGFDDIQAIYIVNCGINMKNVSGIFWKAYCLDNSFYEYVADYNYPEYDSPICGSNSRLQKSYCLCDETLLLTNKTSIAVVQKHINPWSKERYDDIPHFEFRAYFEMVLYIMYTILSMLIMFWLMILIHKRNNAMRNIEPPSLPLLLYLYLSDIFMWVHQIGIIIVISWIYRHNIYCYKPNDICDTVDNDKFNYDETRLNCEQSSYIYMFLVCMIVAASISVLLQLRLSHFMCVVVCKKICWNKGKSILTEYYWKRRFFKFSSAYICYFTIRYLSLYIPAFYVCFNWFDVEYNIKLFELLPMLFILIINEIIKIRYKMMPPYNVNKHIQYIINEYYGKTLGNIIFMFLGDSDKYYQEYHQNTVGKKKQSYNSLVNGMVEERSLCIPNDSAHAERFCPY